MITDYLPLIVFGGSAAFVLGAYFAGEVTAWWHRKKAEAVTGKCRRCGAPPDICAGDCDGLPAAEFDAGTFDELSGWNHLDNQEARRG